MKLPDRGLTVDVVDLVDDDEHRCVERAQDIGDPGIFLGDADVRVDDEQDDVGVAHRALGLLADLRVEGAVAARAASRRCRPP